MRAAPSFKLTFGPSALERWALAALAGMVGAALGAWLWSHVDAAAGLSGRGALPWVVVVCCAGAVGVAAGRAVAPMTVGTLAWEQGRWSLALAASPQGQAGLVEVKLDLGSWLLLRFRSEAGLSWWITTGRQRAGGAWHPLRATLYAPGGGAADVRRGAST